MEQTDATHPVYPQLDWGNQGAKMDGLTKRELFAAMAMQGMMSNSIDKQQGQKPWWSMNGDELATEAVHQADCLIEALNKEKP